ncbi:unnamed protein product [Caenorhabditis nigoni]
MSVMSGIESREQKREAIEMKHQMAKGKTYEIPSEVSNPGEPSTKRSSRKCGIVCCCHFSSQLLPTQSLKTSSDLSF